MTDWSRRRFLGAAAAVGAYGVPLETRQRSTRARVIVVGAGVAGLTAAAELRRRGLDGDGEVIVIEARDRIGGRVRTDRSLGYPVELGASWIHGGNRSNPVAGLANALRLPRVATDYESVAAYAGNGKRMSDDMLGEGVDLYEEIEGAIRRRKRRLRRDESWAAALRAIEAEEALDDPVLRMLLFWNLESEAAGGLDELSLLRWDEDYAYSGRDLLLPRGYDELVDGIAPEADVRTGTKARVVRAESGSVVVAADSENAGSLEFSADAVIMAVPIGVLRANAIRFEPGLPDGVTAALGALGFGAGLKLALEFPRTAWPEDRHFLVQGGARSADTLVFSNLALHTERPVLLMESYLDTARRLERQRLRETVAEVCGRLRASIPGLPEPTAARRSDWNSSPLSGGAYSFWKVGSTEEDLAWLQHPIGDRLFLAGEHTDDRYPGTVHGAWRQGVRAARRALKAID